MASRHIIAARLVHQAQRKAVQNYRKINRKHALKQQKGKKKQVPQRKMFLLTVIFFPFKVWLYSIGILLALLVMVGKFLFDISIRVYGGLAPFWRYRHAPEMSLSVCRYWVEELNDRQNFFFVLDGKNYELKQAIIEQLTGAACSIACFVSVELYGQWIETLIYISETTAAELVSTYQP